MSDLFRLFFWSCSIFREENIRFYLNVRLSGLQGVKKTRSLFDLMCSCQSEAVLLSFGLRSRRWGAANAS